MIDQQIVINEQDKDSNPIYKVVYNKIRHLKKKLTQIEHIATLDQKTLKLAQLNKLNKRDQVLNQIKKQEDFAKTYKTILIENNLVYDKVDDLIKLSALLMVGKRIDEQKYCPIETKQIYENVYKQIFHRSSQSLKTDLSDEIIRIYRILWSYLQNKEHYSQCRDYMTYIKEIDERKTKQTSKQQLCQINQVIKLIQTKQMQQNIKDIKNKCKNMSIQAGIIRIQFENLKLEHSQSKNYPLESTLQQQYQQDLLLAKHKQSFSTNFTNNDIEKELIQDELFEKNQENPWIKKERGENDYSHSQPPINKNKRRRHNRKNKHQTLAEHAETDFNIRKCSDTSLEPTPEKYKEKKVKYMEKK